MNRATVIMYHYVRDLPLTRYPHIKGLLTSKFEAQLDYVQRHYEFVRVEDVIATLHEGAALPPNAALLTFDDGYIDHYTTVFPTLARRGIQGAFFPPAAAVLDRRMLDVNKVHFVLAAAQDHEALMADVLALLDEIRHERSLPSNADLFRALRRPGRFDPENVVFIKRLLQKGLPREARALLADRLFETYVSTDQAAFADELYMSSDQLRQMAAEGMFIGAHGVDHEWLGELSRDAQIAEIEGSLTFLRDLGLPLSNWAISYPYGSYNDSLLEVIGERGCKLGFTSRPDVAALAAGCHLKLPRLDTNDLPTVAGAPANDWTKGLLVDD